MIKSRRFLYLLLVLPFISCTSKNKYNYAIKDFRKSLQPKLFDIVSKATVMSYDSSLKSMATDEELLQLSESEHPVLRASAFREMLERKSFSHFDILMNHLDDTAAVAIDRGEFGISFGMVSDDILRHAVWKTQQDKNRTIDQVLTKHRYLRSAYSILSEIKPQEKFYSIVKAMAIGPKRLTEDGFELEFDEIEYALYGLAKFRKHDDVKIIKDQMMDNVWKLSNVSFNVMKEFPDTAYFEVLRTYHRRRFYRFSGNRRDGFSGYIADRADPEDFISALVAQQTDSSARLLDTILHHLPLQKCMPDKDYILEEVILEIWQHPCVAYEKLRQEIKLKAKDILKYRIAIEMSPNPVRVDTVKALIRW